MDEHELRGAIERVRQGRLSRRALVGRLVAAGLTAPLATQLLAAGGVAMAQTASAYKPTKAGGGGTLKLLWWQGPTLLNPHFAVGTKDQDGSRLFYQPLAAWDSQAQLRAVLAAELPSRDNGGLSADGKTVVWKLREGVKWHDGEPFTADDVVFNWAYARDPATAAVTAGSYNAITVEKVDDHTVRITSPTPLTFWADAFVGANGMIIPKHLFADYTGARVTRGAQQPQAGRHRTLPVQGVPSGRPGVGHHQPPLLGAEQAVLRCGGDEGRGRRRLGGARGAADRRVRPRLEPAGRGRGALAAGGGGQGRGAGHGGRQPRDDPAELHRSQHHGGRRAVQHQDHPSDAVRPRGASGAVPAGGPRFGAQVHLRPRRQRDVQRRVQPAPVRLAEHALRVQRRQGDRCAGQGGLEARPRRGARQGRQAAQVPVPDLDQRAAAEDAADREAGAAQGRHRRRAEVGDLLGVLLVRRGQPRHLSALLRRPADVHDRPDAARPAAVDAAIPLDRGGPEEQQVAGSQHLPLAQRGVRRAVQAGSHRARPGAGGRR